MNSAGIDDSFGRKDIDFHHLTASGYDDETTKVYGIYHRYSLVPYLDALVAKGGTRHALDLGTGTGVVAEALARRGVFVRGIDHSSDMLDIARGRAAAAGYSRFTTYEEGDVSEIPVPDASQDLVTCQGLLHHLADMRPVVSEIARVLRPGGSFYLSEPTLELTPVGAAIRAVEFSINSIRHLAKGPESIETPIRTTALLQLLDEFKLEYCVDYLTHLPYAHRLLSDSARIRLTILVSWGWRQSRGDIVFVKGSRPI